MLAEQGAWRDAGVTVNLVGPYVQMSAEREIIRGDMRSGAIFGLTGVCLVVFTLFRSFRAVLVLLVAAAGWWSLHQSGHTPKPGASSPGATNSSLLNVLGIVSSTTTLALLTPSTSILKTPWKTMVA
ncbi:MAG: MMPL family transporter [Nitrospiraceae bacterium]|nr:MMPL family transporter [Nitrospiraceae bacterium]